MKNPEIEYVTNTPPSYYIALAAWRRGLNVTFIKNINNYRITSAEESLFFCYSSMAGGRHGLLTHATCKDKHKTKQHVTAGQNWFPGFPCFRQLWEKLPMKWLF